MTPEQFNQFYDSLPPGFFSTQDVKSVFRIASILPKREGMKVVEIGSMLGRSAVCWTTALPQAEIFCIDPWNDWVMDPANISRMSSYFDGCLVNIYDRFLALRETYPKLHPIRGFSPTALTMRKADGSLVFEDKSVDCVFIDALHKNPYVADDIKAAMRIVRPGGVLCGHDYRVEFPDVIQEAHRAAHWWNVEIQQLPFSSVWRIVRPINASAYVIGWAGNTRSYTEVTLESALSVSDADDTNDTNIASGAVTISAGFTSGDTLTWTNQAGIAASYNPGTGVLTLTGNATLATYQALLRSVKVAYSSTSDDPTSASRTITWSLTDTNSDGAGAGTGWLTTVNLTAATDVPVISDADDTNIASGNQTPSKINQP